MNEQLHDMFVYVRIHYTVSFWLHSHETFNVKSLLRTSQSAMSRATKGILMYPNMY